MKELDFENLTYDPDIENENDNENVNIKEIIKNTIVVLKGQEETKNWNSFKYYNDTEKEPK